MTGLPAGLLKLFSLILSPRWIGQWQKAQKQEKDSRGNRKGGRCAKPAIKKKKPQRFYDRIYSLQVTLWCMIFQRLSSDRTLEAVVTELLEGGADHLSRGGRKISRRIGSRSTSAYSQARGRLPVAFLRAALEKLRGHLITLVDGNVKSSGKTPKSRPRSRQILDGSTLCALSTAPLKKDYPPARNGHSISHWCLMRIVVGFCARSGAVLSAVEGSIRQSEQALSWGLFEAAEAFTIWIGDRNFGVWSVISCAKHHRQDVLVRLTSSRARSLARGTALRNGEDRALDWNPSRHDQKAPAVERQGVSGRLIYVRLKRGRTWINLYLFTTLEEAEYPLELLVQWYGQRWQAELHFRYVKTQMKMDQLMVGSPDMARKEFYAGMLAYSLVRAVMWGSRGAVEQDKESHSFSNARRSVVAWLGDWGRDRLRGSARNRMLLVLRKVAKNLLPKRSKTRPNEIRRQRHRSHKFPSLQGSRAKARLKQARKDLLAEAKTLK